jgi:hypothetical protein
VAILNGNGLTARSFADREGLLLARFGHPRRALLCPQFGDERTHSGHRPKIDLDPYRASNVGVAQPPTNSDSLI